MSETPGGTAIAPPNISPFHKRAFPCASMSGCRTSSCPRSESTAPASHSSKDPSLDELAPPTWCSAMASGPRRRNAAAAAALRRWHAAFAGPAAPTMSSSAMPHIRPTDRPRAVCTRAVVTCHSHSNKTFVVTDTCGWNPWNACTTCNRHASNGAGVYRHQDHSS